MKRIMQRWKLSLVITLAIVMLTSSLGAVCVQGAVDMQNYRKYVLPDYLLRLAEYQSNGNLTELARIKNQMIEQEMIKQDRIASTNGAVLKLNRSVQTLSSHPPIYSCLSSLEYSKISPPESFGYVDNPGNVVGTADNVFAHCHTDGWNHHNDSTVMGGEAFIPGYMYGGWASGDFYVQAKIGAHSQSGWQNYVILYVSGDINTPFGQWTYLGRCQVTSSSSNEIYVGTNYASWACLAVMVWTPPPYPIPYSPLVRNCVLIDDVVSRNL